MSALTTTVLGLVLLASHASACSNLLVSAGASLNGTIVSYNADSTALFGSLGLYPAGDHPAGSMRQTWDWDGSFYLGEIPEAPHTYNVVGNINEMGLIIAETTFGGLPELDGHNHGHLIDYGSLIWITLQRAKTAREAIALIDDLTTKYGYASDGESFAIADTKEVWLMEIMSKGNETGTVWVASKVPEGYMTATANQARTHTFVQNDPENVLFAKDVVTFAQARGLYPHDAPAADFSFADVYDPITFTSARFAEARVWSLLNPLSGGLLDKYIDYAQGYNLSNPMPLMVPVAGRITVDDVMAAMRTHNEHTWFDNTGLDVRPDVGAQSGHSPYRSRPLVWKSGANSYVNERTVATQQSAWAFVAHSRSWLPTPIAALMWFAPDDSGSSPRIPVYGCVTRIPPSFGDRYGQVPGAGVPYGPDANAFKMSLDSAFWVWNLVGNIFQGERNLEALPLLHEALARYQALFGNLTAAIDAEFAATYHDDPATAIEVVTRNVVNTGEFMTKEWLQFWMSLFVRFRDSSIITAPPLPVCQQGQTTGCTAKPVVAVTENGYDAGWYGRIVAENGPHYQIPASSRLQGGDKLEAYSARKLKLM